MDVEIYNESLNREPFGAKSSKFLGLFCCDIFYINYRFLKTHYIKQPIVH